MASKCNHCGKFLSPTEGAKCNKCSSIFHRTCVNLSPDSRPPARWACRSCRVPDGKVKSATGTESPTTADVNEDTRMTGNLGKNPAASLAEEMKLLRLELATVAREMASFRLEIGRLNKSMMEFNKRVDTVEERVRSLEVKIDAEFQARRDGSVTEEALQQLRDDINEREQAMLLNDVIISGVPERGGESVMHLTQAISDKLGITLETRDIVSAERAGPRHPMTAGDGPRRSRPIVIRLARRALRDDIMKAARLRRGTDTSGVTDGNPSRVYVNEHLTHVNRRLFYKVREEGKRQGWRYIWTRDGRIYVRRGMETAVKRIRTEKDIKHFFCLN